MEKYSKAVSEMYSQFKQKEAHPMEKYIGRLAYTRGGKSEVVGYKENGYVTPYSRRFQIRRMALEIFRRGIQRVRKLSVCQC